MTDSRLRLSGAITRPRDLSWSDLDALTADPDTGRTGEPLPVRALIDLAGPTDSVTHCTVVSDDGYRAAIPLEDLARGGELWIQAIEAPLDRASGGPFRLRVVDGTTLCWNVKHVAELRFTAGAEADDVPPNPPH